jgi:hypothetical protein
MSEDHKEFGAPVVGRRWKIVGAIVAGLVLMGTMTPARADSTDCTTAAEQLAAWTVRESKLGLTHDLLQDLQELTPMLVDCAGLAARPDPNLEEDVEAVDTGMGDDVERWRPLAGLYFAVDDLDRLLCLMTAESGGNPDARNPGSGASGLMQVMPSWAGVFGYSRADLFRPDVNLWVASQILDRQGWVAWSPYLRGLCRG